MQKRFHVEEVSVSPKLIIIDFLKKEEELLDAFLSYFRDKLSLYMLSKKKTYPGGVQILSSLSEHFIDKLSEKVEYSLVFASKDEKEKTVSYAEKLSKVCEKVFVVIQREDAEAFLLEIEKLEKNQNVGIVFLGNVFGAHFLKQQYSKIIANSISKKIFTLDANPLQPIFLISEKDLFLGFEYLFFSGGKKNGLFPLYYKTPNTVTSLMHALKLVEHELSVSYTEGNEILQKNVIDDESLQKRIGSFNVGIRKAWVGFEAGVKSLISGDIKFTGISKKSKKAKKLFEKVSQGMILFITAFTFFLAVSISMLFLSVHFFQNSVDAFLEGNFNSSKQHMEKSKMLLTYSNPQVSLVLSQVDFISGGHLSSYLNTYSDAVTLSYELITSVSSLDLSKIDTDKIFANTLVLYFIAQNRMPLDNVSLQKYLPLITIFEEAAGYKNEMNYLVLFQNNNELRPTGGFIGSVARITVKDGRLEGTDVRDVYELDGQLVEHVEPHFVIRRYLQPHLYLRDSNFHPDFEVSASSAAQLYNLEMGKNVDGVIAIDTEVLKALVEVLGEVAIPGVDEKINKDNIISIIQDEIHDDFFPGSTEKKEILSSLLAKIIIAFESEPRKQLEFVKKLPDLFSEKHIQLSFDKDHLQRGIIAAGISGSLRDLRISEDLLKDTISINEANIGVNKVNSFVDRKISYSTHLKEQELSSDTLVEYKNTGDEDYTMYFRLIVPEESLLESVMLDSQVQTIVPAVTDPVFYERRGFQPPLGLEVSEEAVSDELKAFGFRVVVPSRESKRIRIVTRRPFFDVPASFDYSLRFIKQPGTLPYPLTVSFQKDPIFKSQKNDVILFNGEATGDMELTTKLQKTSQ